MDKCHDIDLRMLEGINKLWYNIELDDSSKDVVRSTVNGPMPDSEVHKSGSIEEQYILKM